MHCTDAGPAGPAGTPAVGQPRVDGGDQLPDLHEVLRPVVAPQRDRRAAAGSAEVPELLRHVPGHCRLLGEGGGKQGPGGGGGGHSHLDVKEVN